MNADLKALLEMVGGALVDAGNDCHCSPDDSTMGGIVCRRCIKIGNARAAIKSYREESK